MLSPDPLTIRRELGRDSVAYRRASALLQIAWEGLRAEPEAARKRQLWAQHLRLVYGKDVESDRLWIQHTFLVVVAKAIAVALLGLAEEDPKRLLAGHAVAAAGIEGAVESDVFDWVVATAQGEDLVRRIMDHARRFRLDGVETDVLKVLYESLIDRDERHGLGEHYTPDWLAAKIVRRAVERPLEQRVLDPACGSGTFLFHAIRGVLAGAEASGLPPADRARKAAETVAGMDVHPVAVIIARVTYLLALAPVLSSRAFSSEVGTGSREENSVKQRAFSSEVGTGSREENSVKQRAFSSEVGTGSREENAMKQRAFSSEVGTGSREENAVKQRAGAGAGALSIPVHLHDAMQRPGGDASRALSREGGFAHVLVGNPPWIAYRHMSPDLQKRFKELAKEDHVYVGGRLATQNDLCALFTVRTASIHLREDGLLAFVLPLAALTRGQFTRLRSGSFASVRLAYVEAWTMDEGVQPLFPVPSCVVFARRRAAASAMPDTVTAFTGTLPCRDAPEEVADRWLTVRQRQRRPSEAVLKGGSCYRTAFRNGATLYPRMLCLVERQETGRPKAFSREVGTGSREENAMKQSAFSREVGTGSREENAMKQSASSSEVGTREENATKQRAGAFPRFGETRKCSGGDLTGPAVISRRGANEKGVWKTLPRLAGSVEPEFLHATLLGESILPYRAFRPLEAVLPVSAQGEVLTSTDAARRGHAGLAFWMAQAENLWRKHRSRDIELSRQLDHYGKLSSQFPIPRLRIVYAKAGTQPAAVVLRDRHAIIDHKLYWSAPASELEALYLCAILNSETARARTEALQSRGMFGPRDFDKAVFTLPIPRFDAGVPLHRALAEAASQAEAVAAGVKLPAEMRFQRARRLVRDALSSAGMASRIDDLVGKLIGAAAAAV